VIFIGIDPGETTGYFEYWPDTRGTFRQEYSSSDNILLRLADAQQYDKITVACERYVISERTVHATRQPKAQEVIDDVRSLCSTLGIDFSLQCASDAKSMGSNEILKQLGWFARGMRHANDAARHCLLLIARKDVGVLDRLVR
jgi:hypothetical protein